MALKLAHTLPVEEYLDLLFLFQRKLLLPLHGKYLQGRDVMMHGQRLLFAMLLLVLPSQAQSNQGLAAERARCRRKPDSDAGHQLNSGSASTDSSHWTDSLPLVGCGSAGGYGSGKRHRRRRTRFRARGGHGRELTRPPAASEREDRSKPST